MTYTSLEFLALNLPSTILTSLETSILVLTASANADCVVVLWVPAESIRLFFFYFFGCFFLTSSSSRPKQKSGSMSKPLIIPARSKSVTLIYNCFATPYSSCFPNVIKCCGVNCSYTGSASSNSSAS